MNMRQGDGSREHWLYAWGPRRSTGGYVQVGSLTYLHEDQDPMYQPTREYLLDAELDHVLCKHGAALVALDYEGLCLCAPAEEPGYYP